MSRPLAIAHRGASAREVENSLAAFREARALKADAVELDIHATRDGAFVVHHDETIGRQHIPRCNVRDLRERTLGNGEHIPTLAEALEVIVPAMIAFVEVKSLPVEWDGALFKVIDACPAPERVRLHAFDHRIIRRLSVLRPDVPCGVLLASYPVHPGQVMADAGAVALWQEAGLIDAALVGEAHRARGSVYAWTVDDPGDMRNLLALGVDGLCSNRPELARFAIDDLTAGAAR